MLNREFRPNAPPPTWLLATDAVEMPNSPAPMTEIGFAKLGWFRALNKSARNVRLDLSVTAKERRTDRSVCARLKPRKAFRPRLPWTGKEGATSAAGLIRLSPATLGALIHAATAPTRSGRKS